MIRFYADPNCPDCQQAQDLLNEHNFSYEAVDIYYSKPSKDRLAKYQKASNAILSSHPILSLEDSLGIIGFNRVEWEDLLAKK